MNIEWTSQAENRIYDIASYIASDSLGEAEKWLDDIFTLVKQLEDFPEIGRYVPEMDGRRDLRELVFKNYRIIYKIEKLTIYILTVRNYKQVLPINEITCKALMKK